MRTRPTASSVAQRAIVFDDGHVPISFLLNNTPCGRRHRASPRRSDTSAARASEAEVFLPEQPTPSSSSPMAPDSQPVSRQEEDATHKRKEELHECKTCGRFLTGLHGLKRHMITHTDLYPFSCAKCGQQFRSKGSVKRHQSVHTGEKPYPCPWPGCGYHCAQKSDIKSHLRTHTKEKPYKCPFPGCGRAFGYHKALADHKKEFHHS